jgi:hypothetical protein
MKRRKFILGLGASAVGASALFGSGAFTSVEAERSVNVNVAGDANAYLGLEPIDGPNGAYAEITDGTLEIIVGEGDKGVNLNAITHLHRIFRVTNQGTQPVVIYFEELGNDGANTVAVDIGAQTDELSDVSSVGGGDQPSSDGIADENVVDLSTPNSPDDSPGYSELGVYLGEGDSIELGIYVDTSDDNLNDGLNESDPSDLEAGDTLLGDMTVYADATAAENGEYQYVEANSTPNS